MWSVTPMDFFEPSPVSVVAAEAPANRHEPRFRRLLAPVGLFAPAGDAVAAALFLRRVKEAAAPEEERQALYEVGRTMLAERAARPVEDDWTRVAGLTALFTLATAARTAYDPRLTAAFGVPRGGDLFATVAAALDRLYDAALAAPAGPLGLLLWARMAAVHDGIVARCADPRPSGLLRPAASLQPRRAAAGGRPPAVPRRREDGRDARPRHGLPRSRRRQAPADHGRAAPSSSPVCSRQAAIECVISSAARRFA